MLLAMLIVATCVFSAHAQGIIANSLDSDIPTLIREALGQHPAMRSQVSMNDAAHAGVASAKWQFGPTPSVGVERASARDQSFRGDQTVSTVRLQQPIWTGGHLTGNLAKAEAQAMSANADLEVTRQQIALRVIQSWSDAVAAHFKVNSYLQSRDIHTRLLGLVERRTKEGVSSQADIQLARSRLDGVDADLAAANAQRTTALDKLQLLIGRSVPLASLSIVADFRSPEALGSLDDLVMLGREQSPQIAKARAQSKSAEADIQIARSSLSPELYLRAERQYGNFYIPNLDPQNRVFVGLSSSLGAGLSSLSGVDAAIARHISAQEDIQSQQLAVDEQIRSDVTLARVAQQRRTSLERVTQSSKDVYSSWERQFLAGRKQWADLMNAAREQTQNDAQFADAIATQYLAGWRLNVLTQGVEAVMERQPNTRARPQ